MVLWLNGAFGAGKTHTAFELQRRLPGSFVYDPENVGVFIRENLPLSERLEDFQDYPMWRSFNLQMLNYLCEHFEGHIIVPMTITNGQYYDELVGVLAERYELKHFILYAGADTLRRRLASRLEGKGSWAARQIDRCLYAFEHEIIQSRIETDGLTLQQTVEAVAAAAGLELLPDRRGRLRRFADQLMVTLRHIR